MSQPSQKLLNPDALSKAQALGLKARLIVEGVMTGNHRSPMHGISSEFKQHREQATSVRSTLGIGGDA